MSPSTDSLRSGSSPLLQFLAGDEPAEIAAGSENPIRAWTEDNILTWTLYVGPAYQCEIWIIAEEDGSFSAALPYLPGVTGQGLSEDAALRSAVQSACAVVRTYLEQGESVPWTMDPGDLGPNVVAKKWVVVDA